MSRIFGFFPPKLPQKSKYNIQFDGQIHNRDALEKTLGETTGEARTDSELTLSAYQKWGTTCPRHLEGEFAFAIEDREKNQLFCARDRLGIRPFHYAVAGSDILYASQATEIGRSGHISRQYDLDSIVLYFFDDWTEQDRTFYQGIKRLPPAHQLIFNKFGIRVARYWSFEPPEQLLFSKNTDYAAHYRELLEESIKKRLTKPSAIFLSGGIDSAAVACTSHKVGRNNFETYSLTFDEPECNDQGTLKTLTSEGKWPHLNFAFKDHWDWAEMKQTPEQEDMFYDPSGEIIRPLLDTAREKGIKTILTGLGADEVLSPTPHFLADLLKKRRFLSLWQEARVLARDNTPLHHALWHYALRPLLPRPLTSNMRRLFPRKPPDWLNANLVNQTRIFERVSQTFAQAWNRFPDASRNSRYLRLFVWGGYPRVFEQDDIMLRPWNLQYSHPLFDISLITYAFQLPQETLSWRGQYKLILREAMKGIVPDSVRLKPKFQDYSVIAARSIARQRPLFDSWMKDSRLESIGVIGTNRLKTLWPKWVREDDQDKMLRVLSMEKWLRTF